MQRIKRKILPPVRTAENFVKNVSLKRGWGLYCNFLLLMEGDMDEFVGDFAGGVRSGKVGGSVFHLDS